MKETRLIVSIGLEARAKVGIKVRQPLMGIKVKSQKLKNQNEYFNLIMDEINVKGIIFDESNVNDVELDTTITEELKQEGIMRDIVRTIQGMRKDKKLNPNDQIELVVDTTAEGKKIFEKFNDEISKTTGLKEITYEQMEGGELIEMEGFKGRLMIEN
jgi:isoleucyl-tRNA synthetase